MGQAGVLPGRAGDDAPEYRRAGVYRFAPLGGTVDIRGIAERQQTANGRHWETLQGRTRNRAHSPKGQPERSGCTPAEPYPLRLGTVPDLTEDPHGSRRRSRLTPGLDHDGQEAV